MYKQIYIQCTVIYINWNLNLMSSFKFNRCPYIFNNFLFGLKLQIDLQTLRHVTCDITKQFGQNTQSSSMTRSSGSSYLRLQMQHKKPSLPLMMGRHPPTTPNSDFSGYGNATISTKLSSASLLSGSFF